MPSIHTHDVVLMDYDRRNPRGFMYSRTQVKRKRAFISRDAESIPPRGMTMGEMTQAEQGPTYELKHYVDFFAKGIGGRRWLNVEDRGKLKISKRIQTYPKGTLRPGQEVRDTTLNSAPNLYSPSGFAVTPRDSSSGLTGGYEETELWAFVGRDVYSGGDDNWTLETEPQSLDLYYKNGTAFGALVLAPAIWAGTDMPGVAMPYIYKPSTSADWIASNLADGRFKHFQVVKNNAGNDVLWGGNHVFDTSFTLDGAHNNSTTTITSDSDATGVIVPGDIILCGVGGDAEQEPMLVTAVSTVTLTVVRAYGSAAVTYEGGEKIHLYQPNMIKSTSNPINGQSWSSATKVGEKEHPITGMAVHADTDNLLIAKTDGLWQQYYEPVGDSVVGGRLFVRNLTIDYRGAGHPTNFTGVHVFQGHTLLPLGGGGLLDMDIPSGSIRDISFRLTALDETKLHGQILHIESGPECVYIALKDKDSELLHYMSGHLVTVDGVTDWAWEMLGEFGAGAAITDNRTTMFYDATRDDHHRVWVGFTESAVNEVPHFMPIDDRDKTFGYTNDTDAFAEFLDIDFNLPRVSKHFHSLDIGSANLLSSAGRQWAFSHRVDDPTGSFVSDDAVTISPFQTVDLTEGLSGKVLELKAVPGMDDVGSIAPELISLGVKAYLQPDPQRVFPMSLYIADDMMIGNGTIESKARGNMAQIEAWNENSADMILQTPDGREQNVVFLPGTLLVEEVHNQKGHSRESRVGFLLAVI